MKAILFRLSKQLPHRVMVISDCRLLCVLLPIYFSPSISLTLSSLSLIPLFASLVAHSRLCVQNTPSSTSICNTGVTLSNYFVVSPIVSSIACLMLLFTSPLLSFPTSASFAPVNKLIRHLAQCFSPIEWPSFYIPK